MLLETISFIFGILLSEILIRRNLIVDFLSLLFLILSTILLLTFSNHLVFIRPFSILFFFFFSFSTFTIPKLLFKEEDKTTIRVVILLLKEGWKRDKILRFIKRAKLDEKVAKRVMEVIR